MLRGGFLEEAASGRRSRSLPVCLLFQPPPLSLLLLTAAPALSSLQPSPFTSWSWPRPQKLEDRDLEQSQPTGAS